MPPMKNIPEATLRDNAHKLNLEYVGPYLGYMKKTSYMCNIHGIQQKTPYHVESGFGCSPCSGNVRLSDSFIEDLVIRSGLTLISKYVNTDTPLKLECVRHGHIEMTLSSLKRNSGCHLCRYMKGVIDLQEQAEKIGIEYIGPYLGTNIRTKYICNVHGEIEQIPKQVKYGVGCSKCSKNAIPTTEKLKELASKVNLIFIGPYTKSLDKTKYECPIHGEILMLPNNVNRGMRCSSCAKSGFDASSPCMLYLIKIHDGDNEILGYGITKDFTTRLRKHKSSLKKSQFVFGCVVGKYYFDTGTLAKEVESKILIKYSDGIDVEGFHTEATSYTNLEDVQFIIEEHKYKESNEN